MFLVALACLKVEGVLVSILLRDGIRSTPGLDCCTFGVLFTLRWLFGAHFSGHQRASEWRI